ncbi:hypothetical protein C0991_001458 [Blastosporella zonata]|nr:hypothetical protein C0991_001458 [Blastosporella zonata]
MGVANWITVMLNHPSDIVTWTQFLLQYRPRRNITSTKEHPTSGWDRPSMRRCWTLLNQTSRTFASVIKELDGELARTVCLFYLVLRGLDTIEDDMTIPDALKQPLLRSFHIHTFTPGWTFNGCGPDEKDRQLLVEYDAVVEELHLLHPTYRAIIADIVENMATEMADYHLASGIETVDDYDTYCHNVAGLVGEGLSHIFCAFRHEARWLEDQVELSNAMGLLLQKANIILDVREDVDARRYFWPREIWAGRISSMEDLCSNTAREQAVWVQSAMVADALKHTVDALKYLQLLTNQSIFNFCAVPAVMALANLHMCFMNPEMFDGHLKLRKAETVSLVMRATSIRNVALIFSEYARKIHAKAVLEDPNFLRITTACGQIQKWQEHYYPSSPRSYTLSTIFNEVKNKDDSRDTHKLRSHSVFGGPLREKTAVLVGDAYATYKLRFPLLNMDEGVK